MRCGRCGTEVYENGVVKGAFSDEQPRPPGADLGTWIARSLPVCSRLEHVVEKVMTD